MVPDCHRCNRHAENRRHKREHSSRITGPRYTDFSVAPSHNEPDLGRCAFPQPASAGGTASLCTAYGRYLLSGYVELQPFGRTPARHFFLFFEPKFSFGRNIPQLTYTASMLPIAYERSIGVGFQLPKNFELRATQHQVDWLGRYSKSWARRISTPMAPMVFTLRSACAGPSVDMDTREPRRPLIPAIQEP